MREEERREEGDKGRKGEEERADGRLREGFGTTASKHTCKNSV